MISSDPTSPTSGGSAVDRLIAAIRTASFDVAVDVDSSDVRLDATVPGWRFASTPGWPR